jgi:hypothetical protein
MRSRLPAILSIALLLCTLPAWSQNNGEASGGCNGKGIYTLAECQRAMSFFERLQKAVVSNRHEEVANMISFPLSTSLNGKRVKIRSRQMFLRNYNRIFDPAVLCALSQASKTDIWGRDTGFTFKDGAVWWDVIIPRGETIPPDSPNSSAKFLMKVITVNNGQQPGPGCPSAK